MKRPRAPDPSKVPTADERATRSLEEAPFSGIACDPLPWKAWMNLARAAALSATASSAAARRILSRSALARLRRSAIASLGVRLDRSAGAFPRSVADTAPSRPRSIAIAAPSRPLSIAIAATAPAARRRR